MSKSILSAEIKVAINESLGDLLREAYVAEPKKFDLRTERLSEKTKKNVIEIFDSYVDALNKTSAALDGADRTSANSMMSDYRSLKLDEVHNMNASFLKALFFENISDLDSRITMDTLAFLRLERDFGTFDSWQQDFIACCLSSRGGYAVPGEKERSLASTAPCRDVFLRAASQTQKVMIGGGGCPPNRG